jgi:hypothetical protein
MDRTFEATFDDHGHFDMPADFREKHGFSAGAKIKVTEEGAMVRLEAMQGSLHSKKVDPATARAALEKAIGFSGTDGRALKTLLEERKRF